MELNNFEIGDIVKDITGRLFETTLEDGSTVLLKTAEIIQIDNYDNEYTVKLKNVFMPGTTDDYNDYSLDCLMLVSEEIENTEHMFSINDLEVLFKWYNETQWRGGKGDPIKRLFCNCNYKEIVKVGLKESFNIVI